MFQTTNQPVFDKGIRLVVGIPTPLKNDGVGSSVGIMKFPTEWKNKLHVPNHQPGIILVKSRYNTGIMLIANATLRE